MAVFCSRDEMSIACALSHPHLIRMLGVLEEPLGLVMELVQGRPLAEKPNFEVQHTLKPLGAPPWLR